MNARAGLDIGGTKTAVLVVDEAGRTLGEVVQPTDVATPTQLVAGVVGAVYLTNTDGVLWAARDEHKQAQ